VLLSPSPSLVLPLPLGGGGHRWGRVLLKSSPSLWEGEDMVGKLSSNPPPPLRR